MMDIDQIVGDAFDRAIANSSSWRKNSPKKTPIQNLEIGSSRWQEQVKHGLLDGFGIEDIALRLHCHRSHVAAEVKRLRAKGDLAKWWGRV